MKRTRQWIAAVALVASVMTPLAEGAPDAVAQLLQRIAARDVTVAGSDREILRTVLRELNVPPESQIAVFSRTSAQAGLISPSRPRALYFSESVYVGWVPGGLIEAIAIEPGAGLVFYAFDPQDARDGRRTFVQEKSCLRCHAGVAERVPSLIARSLHVDRDGRMVAGNGGENIDDRTPFDRLWGGWYVTGYHGRPHHRGNAFATRGLGGTKVEPSEKRPDQLAEYFDPSPYLASTSDVVALLVFEHQLAVHNSLIRAGRELRLATEGGREQAMASAAEDVLDRLLFRDAAPLPEGAQGAEAFRRVFVADARRDARGDSLKDLALTDRLFANRCSFLIYSEAFAALPTALKTRIFDGLHAALRATDAEGRYAYLGREEKRRILAVLTETHPEVRRHFQNPLK